MRATGWLRRWLPFVLRAVTVLVTAYPAVRKFTEYGRRIEAFRTYGLPWPELAVPLTGVVELVAIGPLAAGVAGRLGAGALVAGMLVVFVTAGPNPASALVCLAAAGVVVLGTGPYSYWDPTLRDLLTPATGDSGAGRTLGGSE